MLAVKLNIIMFSIKKLTVFLLFSLSIAAILVYSITPQSEMFVTFEPQILSAQSQTPVLPQKTFGALLDKIRTASEAGRKTELPPKPSPGEKKTITVALLGDSMTQTLSDTKDLWGTLEASTTLYHFRILNFGVGSTGIKSGLERLPLVFKEKPDIIIVESFAYNIGSMSKDEYYSYLQKIYQSIKNNHAKIIILATIAPNSEIYAKGTQGINFTTQERKEAAERIKIFLKNSIAFAKKENLPLIDCYTESLNSNNEGKEDLIEKTTNIHPSEEGKFFISQKAARVILDNL